jgi:hypothetical protein
MKDAVNQFPKFHMDLIFILKFIMKWTRSLASQASSEQNPSTVITNQQAFTRMNKRTWGKPIPKAYLARALSRDRESSSPISNSCNGGGGEQVIVPLSVSVK